MDLELLKFPVGKYTPPRPVTDEQLTKWKETIRLFPEKLEDEVRELTEAELDWVYRPGGWMIRQVVHHCADSHMNAFIRFKLALTENNPKILPYKQAEWAKLADVSEAAISDSLMILQGLHRRWTYLLNTMQENDFKRTYVHPEYGQTYSLDQVTGTYAWHCSHHLAHVRQAIHHKGKF